MANKITRIQGGTLRTARAQDATVGMNLQTYNGEYNVTPTTEQQTLATRNRLLTNNITVDPMSTDYEILTNKPQINDVTLVGNKSLEDLGIASEADLDGKQDAITASGILKGDGAGNITAATAGTDYGTYSKPSGGIPSSDMASAVQTSLGKANTAYQKPSGGIPASDLASGVIPDVSGFYTKPSGGIPADDIAAGVIPDVSGKLDAPSAAGTLGQVLTSDGEGGQTWEDPTGGTTDYTDLDNKPTINSVTLEGDLSLSDLSIASASDLDGKQAKITASGILKGDGSGGVSAATAGTDYGTYSKPSGGIPSSDMASAVQTSLGKADTAYQKPSGGIPSTDLASAVQTSLGKADTAYQKPSGGIPSTDIATGVIPDVSGFYTKPSGGIPDTDIASASTWNGKYAKPSGGIPSTDLASAVQTSLGKADTAYQKPSGGIPGTDLASGVIPDISGKLDAPSTAGTNGQVLTSNGSGGQTWQTISGLLPSVSSGDNGKFLRVSNGAWAAETVPTAVGVSF